MNSIPVTDTSASIGWVTVYNPEQGISEQVRYDQFVLNLFKPESRKDMCLHAALGVCGEAGELADALKKEWVYGKTKDEMNIIEELGDLRFYMQAIMNLYGINEQLVLQANAAKLGKRYGQMKFSSVDAIARADKSAGSGE